MPLPEGKMRITIVEDSARKPCEAGCATDWTAAETIGAAKAKIRATFGDRVDLDFVDLPKARDNALIRKMRQDIEGMPLPVLMTNGKPRIAGEFDLRQLMDVIETELEAEI
jgi:hypothetical protein